MSSLQSLSSSVVLYVDFRRKYATSGLADGKLILYFASAKDLGRAGREKRRTNVPISVSPALKLHFLLQLLQNCASTTNGVCNCTASISSSSLSEVKRNWNGKETYFV
jgi:hypothetical protein